MHVLLKFILTAFCLASLYESSELNKVRTKCNIPLKLHGQWYSWENGRSTTTEIDATSMSKRGTCIWSMEENHVNFSFVFQMSAVGCYTCVKFIFRTVNVLDKMESVCMTLNPNESPDKICQLQDTQLNTLFLENYKPITCRPSLEGVWQFAYQNSFCFAGECNNPEAQIKSCQTEGTQFLMINEQFNITYKKCPGMTGTFDGVIEYSCLGDWFVGKNHFFAVANTKESQKNEKYRCFLKNRDDDLYIGVSITADCNTLQTPEKSPERLHLNPVKEVVKASCQLPKHFSGEWVNTANMNADVFINETHVIETWYPDETRFKKTIYVCREQRGSRYMMTRLPVNGCQKDYVCFNFMPRRHNIIRYRTGIALFKDDFNNVCSWVRFPNNDNLKYDTFVSKTPVPIRCPVAGRFNFTQKGDILFETRIFDDITLSSSPQTTCKNIISNFDVCGDDQKEITIDESFCIDEDHHGQPINISSDPDYRFHCIGYWKENFKSYLVTYDPLDAASMYRCWVYQRSDLNHVLMSQAIGSFCDFKQDAFSNNYTEGATVAIEMIEYGHESDLCPMHFDDGAYL